MLLLLYGAIQIFADIPKGYKPATDLAIRVCTASFGFIKSDAWVSQKVLAVEECDHRERINQWIKDIAIAAIYLLVVLLEAWHWKNT